MVGKTAVCSLNTSSVWTDSEFGNSIQSGVTPLRKRILVESLCALPFMATLVCAIFPANEPKPYIGKAVIGVTRMR